MVIGFLNMTIFEFKKKFNIFTINIICVKATKVLWYLSFVNKFIQHMLLDYKKLTPMEKYMNKYILCVRGNCYIQLIELMT
jgi:hypothetical protein